MALSEYAKIRILTLWRENKGPSVIVKVLSEENITTTRKSVSLFIGRYVACVCVCVCVNGYVDMLYLRFNYLLCSLCSHRLT